MTEEKKPYVIPQKLIDELSELVPYEGSENCKTPEEYILYYFFSGSPATFFKNGILQCNRGRKRSFVDLYFLTKVKFPEYTFEEFVKFIFSKFYKRLEHPDGYKCQIASLYCPDVSKPILACTTSSFFGINRPENQSDLGSILFNRATNDGNPTYTELFAIAGVEKTHFVGKSFIEE